jgi:putative acetyltransferase
VIPGGDVLLARDDGGRVIGCVALEPAGQGVFELSKMAVARSERGRGGAV